MTRPPTPRASRALPFALAAAAAFALTLSAPRPAVAGPAMPDAALAGHKNTVTALAFSPDGTRLASVADDGHLTLWDVAARKELADVEGAGTNRNQVRFTPDGGTVVAAGVGPRVLVVDAKTGKAKKPIEVADLPGGVSAVDLSPDGRTVAVVGRGALRLYDLATGARKAGYEVHKQYGVSGVAFSPDGKRVATASNDKTALVIDLAGETVERTLPLKMNGEIVAFARDGKSLFVYTSDRMLSAFDLTLAPAADGAGAGRPLVDQGIVLTTMAVAADGKSIVVGGFGRGPRLVSVADGKVAGADQYDSEDRVTAAAASPDGKWLAGGGNLGAVYLWKVGG